MSNAKDLESSRPRLTSSLEVSIELHWALPMGAVRKIDLLNDAAQLQEFVASMYTQSDGPSVGELSIEVSEEVEAFLLELGILLVPA